MTDPVYTTDGKYTWKCNAFVAKCYTNGAGIGHQSSSNPSGYPVNRSWRGNAYPPAATDIHNTSHPISNLVSVKSPQIGDIVAFGGGHYHGHVGIYLGGNLIIYAGQNDVKLGTIPYVQKSDGFNQAVTYRRYVPAGRR